MNRQWVMVSRPTGPVTVDNFQLVEKAMPEPGPGQALVRNRMLSIEPANRAWM